jgi:hypothetical protein
MELPKQQPVLVYERGKHGMQRRVTNKQKQVEAAWKSKQFKKTSG